MVILIVNDNIITDIYMPLKTSDKCGRLQVHQKQKKTKKINLIINMCITRNSLLLKYFINTYSIVMNLYFCNQMLRLGGLLDFIKFCIWT